MHTTKIRVFIRCFREPIRVPRIENRVPSGSYRVPNIFQHLDKDQKMPKMILNLILLHKSTSQHNFVNLQKKLGGKDFKLPHIYKVLKENFG